MTASTFSCFILSYPLLVAIALAQEIAEFGVLRLSTSRISNPTHSTVIFGSSGEAENVDSDATFAYSTQR